MGHGDDVLHEDISQMRGEGETASIETDRSPSDPAAPPLPTQCARENEGDDGASGFDRVVAQVAALAAEVAATNERASAREGVIERLFTENDRLRGGERALILRPVAVDLQRLRNDLLKQAESLPADMSAAQTADLLQSFAFSAEQALERCGVVVIRPEPRTPFDPKHHRAAAAVPAPAPDMDAVIADVIADGYLDSATDRTITTATVRVYRWIGPSPEPAMSTAHDPIVSDADAPVPHLPVPNATSAEVPLV